MNPQNAAAQLLYKIVGGVIPPPAKEQGMLVQAQHEQIALVSLHAFHDRPHSVPLNKFGCQDYTFPPSGLLRASLEVAVVIGGLNLYVPVITAYQLDELV
jgi:hypothetical protein